MSMNPGASRLSVLAAVWCVFLLSMAHVSCAADTGCDQQSDPEQRERLTAIIGGEKNFDIDMLTPDQCEEIVPRLQSAIDEGVFSEGYLVRAYTAKGFLLSCMAAEEDLSYEEVYQIVGSAISDWHRARELGPQCYESYLLLANANRSLQDFHQANQFFEEAIALGADSPEISEMHQQVHAKALRVWTEDEAATFFQQQNGAIQEATSFSAYQKINQNFTREIDNGRFTGNDLGHALLLKGFSHVLMGDQAESAEQRHYHVSAGLNDLYRSLLKLPDFYLQYHIIGITLYEEYEDYAKAEQMLQRALELVPDGVDSTEIREMKALAAVKAQKTGAFPEQKNLESQQVHSEKHFLPIPFE